MTKVTQTKTLLAVLLAGSAAWGVRAADVVITEVPADTARIVVKDGTTSVIGQEGYGHLTHYWSFDDETSPLVDSVGGVTLTGKNATRGTDAKRGGGAMSVTSGLKAPSNFIDGRHPFTLSMWFKYTKKQGSQATMFHIGGKPEFPVGVEKGDTPYMRLSFNNYSSAYFLWNNQVAHSTWDSKPTSNDWCHIALTCEVIERENCVTTNRYRLYQDGVRVCRDSSTKSEWLVPQQEFPADNFIIGSGYHYQGGTKSFDGLIDEVMCFDTCLSQEAVQWYKENTAPDFSAGWDVYGDGTLSLPGVSPVTALIGSGACETSDPLKLNSVSNAFFWGTVETPALAYAGVSSVTQTLAGTVTSTGATTVASGTLELASTPMQLFGDALVAWYPFEDETNPGRDFSPRGNDLRYDSEWLYEATRAGAPLATVGRALIVTNNTKQLGLYSSGTLKGFAAATDNSFTVSFWMRSDKGHYREGPFAFTAENDGVLSGFRRENDSSSRLGDTSYMETTSDRVWGNGEWHHWIVVFDASADTNAGERCYFFFRDGALYRSFAKRNTAVGAYHATGRFRLARGMSSDKDSGPSIFDGAMDEVIVLNTADTNNVAKLYGFRRKPREAGTGVLPATTELSVAEGATLKLSGANETVAKLTGKGTIDLSDCSSLTVTVKDRFDGTVVGGTITDAPGAERKGVAIVIR